MLATIETTYLETLDYDRVLIIEETCSVLILNRSNILLQSAAHRHNLPLGAIFGDSTILATALASHLQDIRFVPRLDHKLSRVVTLWACDVLADFCSTLKLAKQIVTHLCNQIIVLLKSRSTARRSFSEIADVNHNLLT